MIPLFPKKPPPSLSFSFCLSPFLFFLSFLFHLRDGDLICRAGFPRARFWATIIASFQSFAHPFKLSDVMPSDVQERATSWRHCRDRENPFLFCSHSVCVASGSTPQRRAEFILGASLSNAGLSVVNADNLAPGLVFFIMPLMYTHSILLSDFLLTISRQKILSY